MKHRQLLAAVLPLLCACAFQGVDQEGRCAFDGLFEEGRVFVRFNDNVEGEAEARELIEAAGFEVDFFHGSSPARARIIVPEGEECAVMLNLQEHPDIKYTALVIYVYAR